MNIASNLLFFIGFERGDLSLGGEGMCVQYAATANNMLRLRYGPYILSFQDVGSVRWSSFQMLPLAQGQVNCASEVFGLETKQYDRPEE